MRERGQTVFARKSVARDGKLAVEGLNLSAATMLAQ